MARLNRVRCGERAGPGSVPMQPGLDKSIISPVLVGRAAQVAALNRRAAMAWAGQGQTVVLAGEAGVGKSRLVAETVAHCQVLPEAAPGPLLVLQGRAFEPDQALPYAPLIDLLRTAAGAWPSEVLAARVGPTAPE